MDHLPCHCPDFDIRLEFVFVFQPCSTWLGIPAFSCECQRGTERQVKYRGAAIKYSLSICIISESQLSFVGRKRSDKERGRTQGEEHYLQDDGRGVGIEAGDDAAARGNRGLNVHFADGTLRSLGLFLFGDACDDGNVWDAAACAGGGTRQWAPLRPAVVRCRALMHPSSIIYMRVRLRQFMRMNTCIYHILMYMHARGSKSSECSLCSQTIQAVCALKRFEQHKHGRHMRIQGRERNVLTLIKAPHEHDCARKGM